MIRYFVRHPVAANLLMLIIVVLGIAVISGIERETVNFQPANSPGGENYGWRCYEADNAYIQGGCADISTYTFPVLSIPHGSLGCSITGGFVYRGADNPGLYGRYIYTDFCSGRISSIRPTDDGGWINEELLNGTDFEYSTFGLDSNDELYMAGINSGNIWKINDDCTITADVTIQNEGCAGDLDGSITVVASGTIGQIDYIWSTDETGGSIQDLGAGTYFVTITDDSSCELIVQVDVDDETPDPVIALVSGDLLTQSGAAAYQWFLDGVPIDGATGDSYMPIESGQYQVQVTGSTGCVGVSDAFEFVATDTINPIVAGWLIAPNPVVDFLQIESPGIITNGRIRVMDALGRSVYDQAVDGQVDLDLNTTSWSPGVYFVRFDSETIDWTVKIIR